MGEARGSAPAPQSPSILLITIDTLRADHVGCYGDARVGTPVMDALAAAGVRFENAYAQAPITLPSHAVILTGTYPMYNGVRDFTSPGLPASIPTLAEMLRVRGYHTAAFVSSYALNSMWGLNRGFEVYDDDLGLEPGRSSDIFLVERRGDRTVDRLLAWLNTQGSAPLFVWLHLYDPHSPYRPPEPYLSKYAGHPYDGEIAFDDAQVGRVIARLKELRRFNSMAVLLLSDHGESLGEHGEDEHGFFIYNATLHVPLIIKLPGNSPTARAIARPVGSVDVAPTIAQLCGIPAAETRSFQGRSLLAALSPAPSQDEASVYSESYYPLDSFGWHELRGLLTARFAFIDAPRPELYDLQRDPEERHNLAASNTSIAASLREKLRMVEQRYTGQSASTPTLSDPETVERLRSLGYVSLQSSLAAKNDPNRADPKDKIETLHLVLRASDLRRERKFAEAEELLANLEKAEPTLYVVPFDRGENYLAWGKTRQALPEFGKALSLNPAFDQAVLGIGRAHFMLGQDKPAAESLELALRMNPRNFLARLALAKVYWRQNLPAKAEPELARVVREHPELAEGHADYAIILAKQARYREAMPHFERALAAEYRDPVLYNYLGISYGELGEREKARAAYKQALALNPSYAAAYLNLALLARKQNQPDEARQQFQKACEFSATLCHQYAAQFPQP
ncbi:MAG: sulfatase-like hydrolase/transferase [Acidobacteriota bacterium]|nr:sulfatase-like hydrolase/transferase [Acidobacteriota bacterium]